MTRVNIMAWCPRCELAFPSGFALEDVRDVSLLGSQTQCPRCRRACDIPSGVYSAIGEVLRVEPFDQKSHADLISIGRRLQHIQRQAKKQPPAATAQALGETFPEAKGLFSKQWGAAEYIAFIALLLQMIQIYLDQAK